MFSSISRSYRIFKESLSVLRQDKEILVFPVLSGIFCLLALAGMGFGGYSTGLFEVFAEEAEAGSGRADVMAYVFLFVWYFVSWLIVIFFNVATIQCATIRLEGGDPTVGDGLSAGFAHLHRIVPWALVSATVGLLLHALERSSRTRSILRMILGTIWAALTYFVVPVMIFEEKGLFASIKRSGSLVKETWGEALSGHIGVGIFTFLLALPGLALPFLFGAILGETGILVGVGLMLAWWLGLAALSTALTGVFLAGLYRYATEGEAPAGFDEDLVEGAFHSR